MDTLLSNLPSAEVHRDPRVGWLVVFTVRTCLTLALTHACYNKPPLHYVKARGHFSEYLYFKETSWS